MYWATVGLLATLYQACSGSDRKREEGRRERGRRCRIWRREGGEREGGEEVTDEQESVEVPFFRQS
jgi:hypothetical protein